VTKGLAIFFAALAVAYVALRPSPSSGPLPKDVPGLAARLTAHPTDWTAASALTEQALDAPVRDRKALWQASNELAVSLAPLRHEPRIAFARSGFFHWEELSDAERKAVLEAYLPVMHDDPLTFGKMVHLIYRLSGDFDYLRRAAPPTADAIRSLAWIAATYGRFDRYRALRTEAERGEQEPRKAPGYVKEAWSGLCGEDVCFSAWREIDANRAVTISVKTIDTDDVRPYVEVYVDGARSAEGPIEGETTFTAPVSPGTHQVEVRLANSVTRNSVQRRVRITSLHAL
jgi:hypothetical protein